MGIRDANWKSICQIAVIAAIGAAIFEAGRYSALREFLRGDYDRAETSDNSPLPRPKLIQEMRTTMTKLRSERQVKGGGRKKYADPPLISRDRDMISACESVMDEGDFVGARALAKVAAQSSRREVREAAVRMISWFGKKNIAELTPFLADKDEDVAMMAAAEWKRIFSNECDDAEKLSVAALVMNRLTSEEMLDDLGVEDVFNEVADERAAVEALIGIIKQGNSAGVKVAKSAYDTITGEKWKGEEAARKWISTKAADPV